LREAVTIKPDTLTPLRNVGGTPVTDHGVHRSGARERVHELGEVPPAERVRLARFGVVLRAERGAARLTQAELAARAGVSRLTIVRLETAARRPTTTTTWRIAKALRPRGTRHDQVAVDERLRVAAGASLRDYSRRPHARREAVRRELLAETAAGGGPGVHRRGHHGGIDHFSLCGRSRCRCALRVICCPARRHPGPHERRPARA